jgi:hypothetical protein
MWLDKTQTKFSKIYKILFRQLFQNSRFANLRTDIAALKDSILHIDINNAQMRMNLARLNSEVQKTLPLLRADLESVQEQASEQKTKFARLATITKVIIIMTIMTVEIVEIVEIAFGQWKNSAQDLELEVRQTLPQIFVLKARITSIQDKLRIWVSCLNLKIISEFLFKFREFCRKRLVLV